MTTAESLESHVERIRRTVMARHGTEPGEGHFIASTSPLELAQQRATVSAHWGIVSTMPVIGRPLVLFRRALRIILRWYINPIVEQQNAFNQAAVRALYDLKAENDELRAELARHLEMSHPDR